MSPPFNVLFLCAANACRSPMAEAILRHVGGDRFIAHSAGLSPAGFVHPLVALALQPLGISASDLRSKAIEEVASLSHDVVITLCDTVACVLVPDWVGQPVLAHWSLPDPVLYPGTKADRLIVAEEVARKLHGFIGRLVALPLETMPAGEIRDVLFEIGQP